VTWPVTFGCGGVWYMTPAGALLFSTQVGMWQASNTCGQVHACGDMGTALHCMGAAS
jgi:hypothetical protein